MGSNVVFRQLRVFPHLRKKASSVAGVRCATTKQLFQLAQVSMRRCGCTFQGRYRGHALCEKFVRSEFVARFSVACLKQARVVCRFADSMMCSLPSSSPLLFGALSRASSNKAASWTRSRGGRMQQQSRLVTRRSAP